MSGLAPCLAVHHAKRRLDLSLRGFCPVDRVQGSGTDLDFRLLAVRISRIRDPEGPWPSVGHAEAGRAHSEAALEPHLVVLGLPLAPATEDLERGESLIRDVGRAKDCIAWVGRASCPSAQALDVQSNEFPRVLNTNPDAGVAELADALA